MKGVSGIEIQLFFLRVLTNDEIFELLEKFQDRLNELGYELDSLLDDEKFQEFKNRDEDYFESGYFDFSLYSYKLLYPYNTMNKKIWSLMIMGAKGEKYKSTTLNISLNLSESNKEQIDSIVFISIDLLVKMLSLSTDLAYACINGEDYNFKSEDSGYIIHSSEFKNGYPPFFAPIFYINKERILAEDMDKFRNLDVYKIEEQENGFLIEMIQSFADRPSPKAIKQLKDILGTDSAYRQPKL